VSLAHLNCFFTFDCVFFRHIHYRDYVILALCDGIWRKIQKAYSVHPNYRIN
jgi:hypothetical protein